MDMDAVSLFFRRLGKNAIELLAPPRCRACGAPLWGCGNPFLCAECLDKMEWIGGGACRRCGFPAGKYAAWSGDGCARCKGRKRALKEVAAVVRYGGGAKNLVKSLKFRGERTLAPAMGALMAERAKQAGFADRIDCVAPVSLHANRARFRGFDQAALLAGVVAERLGVPCAAALKRVRETRPQALLRRAERLRTMEGVFEADPPAVRERRILLVDDVFTTGATMSAAAAACKKGGAAAVYGVAFAR